MIRQITVDKNKCTGCGLCILCCEDEAITLYKNKAYINTLPVCMNCKDCIDICSFSAISLKEMANKNSLLEINQNKNIQNSVHTLNSTNAFKTCGLNKTDHYCTYHQSENNILPVFNHHYSCHSVFETIKKQAPYDLRLMDENTILMNNANILIAANCIAEKQITKDLAKNRLILLGCPKEKDIDYTAKLRTIIDNNNIRNLSIVLSEHPCCIHFKEIVKEAIIHSKKTIPWNILFINKDEEISKKG